MGGGSANAFHTYGDVARVAHRQHWVTLDVDEIAMADPAIAVKIDKNPDGVMRALVGDHARQGKGQGVPRAGIVSQILRHLLGYGHGVGVGQTRILHGNVKRRAFEGSCGFVEDNPPAKQEGRRLRAIQS